MTAEEDLNDCLGRMGRLVKDTVGATHAFHCSVPDRDSNEVRYLQDALDTIEDFKRRGARQEMAEVIWVEAQRQVHRLARDEAGNKLEMKVKVELQGSEATEDT